MQNAAHYTNVAAGTATTVIKASAGRLYGINVNTKGATGNTLTVYDNSAGSGTKIATIDTTSAVGGILVFPEGFNFYTGLTCVSATGTGADYTVIWE